MKQKNRFSSLLERLMEVAELKNYTLANELQYDVSYISKWVSGRMLPSAKTDKVVLQGISQCLVKESCEEGLRTLMSDYQVDNTEDLASAIYDNLIAEYNYVRDTQNDTGNSVAPDTVFYPKLNMPQFLSKMHHPVLRRVNSLDIMAMMDLMYMERDYRIQIASIDSRTLMEQRRYPDVHFSMFIDLGSKNLEYIYDITFLLNMLTNMTHIDFKLYGGKQAFGKAIFAVKDEFAISGMLTDRNQCISVTVSEEPENSDTLYRYIQSLCTRERLLVVPSSMKEMLLGNHYTRAILSPNQRIRVGHLTERFLPRDVFDEVIAQLQGSCKEVVPVEELQWIHDLTEQSHREMPIQLLFNDSAFSEFAVTGELNFFNMKVVLTPDQRLRCIQHIYDTIRDNDNLGVKMVYGRLISDFQYVANQCISLNDSGCVLRLMASGQFSINHVNHADLKYAFTRYFEEIWNLSSDVVLSSKEEILSFLDHTMRQTRMINKLYK